MSNHQQSEQYSPRCPRCEGRLFMDSEFQGRRLLYYWECSLGCSRQWDLNGKPRSYIVSGRRVRVFREPVLVTV